jgi:hypothetical protein
MTSNVLENDLGSAMSVDFLLIRLNAVRSVEMMPKCLVVKNKKKFININGLLNACVYSYWISKYHNSRNV